MGAYTSKGRGGEGEPQPHFLATPPRGIEGQGRRERG